MGKLFLLVLLLAGCDVAHSAKPDTYYKRDAIIEYNGKRFVGVAVLPKQARYDLQFSFAADLDLFTFRTCHREITQEEFGDGGIFNRNQNRVRLTYEPQPGVETGTYCPIEVGGYEAEKGRHGWGFVDFEGDTETLSAVVECNGKRQAYNGVSVCQSAAGLIQEVIFPTEVYIEGDCKKPETRNGKTFRFFMPTGRCIYVAREKNALLDKDGKPTPYRFHRFTTIGYESILVRKVL